MSVVINPRKTPAPLLVPHRIEVSDFGSTVRLTIGNSNIDFDYATALQLSAWLRVHGAHAKAAVGDRSRSWNAVGILEDAERVGEQR